MHHQALQAFQRAAIKWPDVRLRYDLFAAHYEPDATIFPDDLYLFLAVRDGDEHAVRTTEEMFGHIVPALQRLRLSDAETLDVLQEIRCRLLVRDPDDGDTAKYRGTGPLFEWLKVAATRLALERLRTSSRRAALISRETFMTEAASEGELDPWRARNRTIFRNALVNSIASLSAQDKLLLKAHFIDDLGIDELGRLLGLHRSTAARRLVSLKKIILERVKAVLAETLDVSTTGVMDIATMFERETKTTLTDLWGPGGMPDEPQLPIGCAGAKPSR